jgi:hypothetical protein
VHPFLNSEAYASFVLSMTAHTTSLGVITLSDAEITQVLNVLPDVSSAFGHFCAIADRLHDEVANYEILQSEPNHNNVGVFAVILPDNNRLQLNVVVARESLIQLRVQS